jgi:multiple sugar transport system ATP-binding protein
MDTLVHFQVSGTEVCGRVNPAAATRAGSRAKLVADLNHMHLIEDETGKVL